MNQRSLTALVLCGALLMTGCGKSSSKEPPVTPTSGAPATTTTAPPPPTAALTGLPLADDGIRNRPLLTVKIDNHPEARPQFGIDKADVIVEEKVEGDISRFMALFQSADSDRVGPVRSLRSTDAHWLRPLGGMIAYSGGIDPVKNLLKPNGIVDLGADNHGAKYYKRRKDRPFEHSMYTTTPVLRELTPSGLGAPKPLFSYLKEGQAFNGPGARPITSVSARMGGRAGATAFDWTWDAAAGVFRRGTDGRPHNVEGVGQIGMKTVVLQFTPYRPTPWRDRSNTVVDEAIVEGSGDAWFLANGLLIPGKWSRPSADAVTSYTDASGAPMLVPPGQAWISLVPPNAPNEIR